MAAFETFEEWQAAVDRQTAETWQRNGGGLAFDPINPGIGVGHVLHDDEEDDWETRQARVDTFQRLMDFLFAEGPNPLKAMRRLYVLARCASPQHVAHMNQTEMAVLLNETRAATCEREQRLWERMLERLGFFGTRRPLKKSDGARASYAETAKGNHSRLGGKKAERRLSLLRRKMTKDSEAG